MNSAKNRLSQLFASAAPYKSQIQLVLYLIVSAILVYTVYIVVFPPPDTQQQVIIRDTRAATALSVQEQVNSTVPIETGGEYTFQTWIYIANWDYKAGQMKHVFTIASDGPSGNGRPDHVTMMGALYPNENKMMIRVYQDNTTTSGSSQQSQSPDFTVKSNLTNLFGGTMGVGMFDTTMTYPICDIQDIDLQKWICLTVVVNGRVVDVYVDGKLARSCVTAGIPTVEAGNQYVTVGQFNGWGGNVSTTSVYGYALTPGKIYEIYQNGPADTTGGESSYGFLGWLMGRLNLSVTSGSKPGSSNN